MSSRHCPCSVVVQQQEQGWGDKPTWTTVCFGPCPQASGIFWVSRTARDRDASLRSHALTLLAALLGPGAHATQRMVATGWPDAPGRLMRSALDMAEAYAVRAAALRALCVALALPSSLHGPDHEGLTPAGRSLVELSPEALLKQAHFWEALPAMIRDRAAPPMFTAAATELLLQGLAVDVETFAAYLKLPGMLAGLLSLTAPEGQQRMAEAAAGGVQGLAAATLLIQAGGAIQAELQHYDVLDQGATGLAMQAQAGVLRQLTQSSAVANTVPSYLRAALLSQPQTPAAGTSSSEASTNSVEGPASRGVPAMLEVLGCSTAATQVVELAVMEPELLDAAALGHTPVALLAAALGVLLRHGPSAVQVDK